MIRHMRHGSPPRLLALQSILSPNRRESLSTPSAGVRIIPHPVLLITVGADVQDDRIEATVLGWPRTGAPYVLGHVTFEGNTLDDAVWSEFDGWLRTARWRNERGWRMGVDA